MTNNKDIKNITNISNNTDSNQPTNSILKSWVTLGSDPEFFCFDVDKKEFIALCDLIPGTKKEPAPIEVQGCLQQVDNVSVEFCVPPSPTLDGVYESIISCLKMTEIYLKGINPAYTLIAQSSAHFNSDQLCNPISTTFGCDPANTIYGDPLIPNLSVAKNLRTNGFHIHFGFDDKLNEEQIKHFILLCDLFLGLPSYIIDEDTERRKLYGLLGEYRIQPWGIEYRSLGGGMFHHKAHIQKGLDKIKKIIENNQTELYYNTFYKEIQNIYNTKISQSLAKLLINKTYILC